MALKRESSKISDGCGGNDVIDYDQLIYSCYSSYYPLVEVEHQVPSWAPKDQDQVSD